MLEKLKNIPIKKIAKYTVNTLTIVNALIVGLDPIWNIPYADKIVGTIAVFMAVISTYLLGDKAIHKAKGE
jgi:hypothetical protein